MPLKNQQETFDLIFRAASESHVNNALERLEDFAADMLHAETKPLKEADRENIEYCKLKIARLGLQLSQFTIPLLQQLVNRSLEVAGAPAIRQVCEPGKRDFGGGHEEEIPSDFKLPPEYEESALNKIGKIFRGR
jgi:hypothetical protein